MIPSRFLAALAASALPLVRSPEDILEGERVWAALPEQLAKVVDYVGSATIAPTETRQQRRARERAEAKRLRSMAKAAPAPAKKGVRK